MSDGKRCCHIVLCSGGTCGDLWGKACRVSSVPAMLYLSPGEMRSSKCSVGGCNHSLGVWGLCSSPCPLPFPAVPTSSHSVFAMLDGAHLADRQGDIILSGSVPKQESEGTGVASCSQLRWLLLPSCCPWLAGFADPCSGHRSMQELPSALSSVWLL